MLKYFSTTTLIVMLVLCSHSLSAQTPAPVTTQQSPAWAEAMKLLQEQKWPEAVKAFENVTQTNPGNGMAWYNLGVSLNGLNKHQEAIAPLQKAVEILQGPVALYVLGSTYAKLDQKEKAFENLSQAANAGFAQHNRIQTDPNLATLRDDSRYQKILDSVRRTAFPCPTTEKARQFDFWVGEWDVQVNGQSVGTNVIQKIEDGCVILENWTGRAGFSGKSMNFFNPHLGTWRQTYVGNNLTIWEMSGEYKDGAMRYSGQVFTAAGAIMTRVTLYNLEPGRVRHTQENSTDGGTTWTNVWDSLYIRKPGKG